MVGGWVTKPKTTNKGKTMIRPKRNDEPIQLTKQDLMKLLTEDDAMKHLLQKLLKEVLEAEMETALQAGKSERTGGRLGYRSGHYPRTLVTRVGKLELKVPQDRQGRFSTELFERYQRSEKALVAALMQMYVQGVSTRRVKTITEELCGHEFSASAISELNVKMDEELKRFMHRRLDEAYPYIILDARYERVRENGVGQSRAVAQRDQFEVIALWLKAMQRFPRQRGAQIGQKHRCCAHGIDPRLGAGRMGQMSAIACGKDQRVGGAQLRIDRDKTTGQCQPRGLHPSLRARTGNCQGEIRCKAAPV
jgi:hypothetical protein